MSIIDYVNAPAGAGKTYAATAWIGARTARGEKIILVQPITRLVAETVDTTFPAQGIDASLVTEITERTHPNGGIVASIIQHLNTAPEGRGEVLIITHAAFEKVAESYATNRERWTVLIDETLSVDASYLLNLPNSHEMLTRHLEVRETSDPVLWPIAKKAGSTKLDQIAQNRGRDDGYNHLQPFATAVVSPHRSVYVLADAYNALVDRIDVPGVRRQLIASSVLLPTILHGWRRTVVMAACFTDTLMHLVWSHRHQGSATFNDITARFALRYDRHRNGDLLDIYYGLDQHWSKNLARKIVETVNGRKVSLLDAFVEAASAHLGDQPVAVLANNDMANIEKRFTNGMRLPAYAHGLNTYLHYDHAVLLLAANPTPAHIGFLKRVADLSDDEIKTATHCQMIYQAATRTSLRDPSNRGAKTLFVPDRGTAEWLQKQFPGARLRKLDLGLTDAATSRSKPGRSKQHENNADRQQAYRDRKAYEAPIRLERELRLRLVNGYGIEDRYAAQAGFIAEGMIETLNVADAGGAREGFHGTFFLADLSHNIGHVEAFASFDELVNVLQLLSAETHASKTDCWLWSPSYYVPHTRNDNPQETRCGYVNIAFCRHIILDNDGGDLTPQQFAAMFPGLRMVTYSTWSSSASCPKWRALIPTDILLDIEGYKLITARILALLRERGFYDRVEIEKDPALQRARGFAGIHGFDRSKLNPAARLYVPSLGARPADAFFQDYSGGLRHELPVFEWIESASVPPRPAEAPTRSAPVDLGPNPRASERLQRLQTALLAEHAIRIARTKNGKIEAALEWWAFDGDRPGKRDYNFAHLAGRLYRAGCDQFELESHLRSAAAASRGSRSELRSKIGRLWRVVSR